MKVVLNKRPGKRTALGGDDVQIEQTATHLEALGLVCQILDGDIPDLSEVDYDILHVFNLTRPSEALRFAMHAAGKKRPVVLTPILIEHQSSDRHSGSLPRRVGAVLLREEGLERAKAALRGIRGDRSQWQTAVRGYRNLQRQVVSLADAVVANSHAELRQVASLFDIRGKSNYVVYNGVESDFGERPSKESRWAWLSGAVVVVARIEERKNQLRVIEAMSTLPYRLVLVGPASTHDHGYTRRVLHRLKEIGGTYVGQVGREDIANIFSFARVSVLASWSETTGLVNLEALKCGCSVVVAESDAVREYLADGATYCNPGDVQSIRHAIVQAYGLPSERGKRVLAHTFTWDVAAKELATIYKQVLSAKVDDGNVPTVLDLGEW